MVVERYRLKAAEKRALDAAIDAVEAEAAHHIGELKRLKKQIEASVPEKARSEASREWVNYVLRQMLKNPQ